MRPVSCMLDTPILGPENYIACPMLPLGNYLTTWSTETYTEDIHKALT